MSRPRILFTSTLDAPFVSEDSSILRRYFDVTELRTVGVWAPIRILTAVVRHDCTFTWFASVYSFFVVGFAVLFGRPSVVVVGGVDVAYLPEIGYGLGRSRWKRVLAGWALRHASRVLVVDASLMQRATTLAGYDGANIQVVPTGYDVEFWVPSGPKEEFVLTVAGCSDEPRFRAKGIDFLFATALRLPDVRFVLVGVSKDLPAMLRISVPHNVEMVPPCPRGELLRFYQRAAVYCQPSYTEGLPNSLCEAMLCGCRPVGTTAGGIPTAIGDTGFLVPHGDSAALASSLRKALAGNGIGGPGARERIATLFPLRRREDELRKTIDAVMV